MNLQRIPGFVLTPGRYVGAGDVVDDGEPFEKKMGRLEGEIAGNLKGLVYQI